MNARPLDPMAEAPAARRLFYWPAWAGIAALLLAAALAASGAVAATAFWSAWLAACWWCLGMVLGAAAAQGIHRLTGGAWGSVLAPAAQALAGRLPWVLLLFLPLLLSLAWPGDTIHPALYPWAVRDGGAWAGGLAQPGFKLVWLSPLFFTIRAALYAAVAFWLVRPRALARMGPGRAALGLVVYLLLGSLAAVDAIASLLPRWHSSVFGLALLTGQLLAGVAAGILLTAYAVLRGRLPAPPRQPGRPPVWRDLGNLLLMAVMLWAYLGFMQFLIVWAENLPEEIAWFVPRLHTGWRWVGLALVLLQFALPLSLLLFRALKDQPNRLAAIAALALAAQLLDAAWLVLPSVAAHNAAAVLLLPLLAAGLGLLVFGGVPATLREGHHAPR